LFPSLKKEETKEQAPQEFSRYRTASVTDITPAADITPVAILFPYPQMKFRPNKDAPISFRDPSASLASTTFRTPAARVPNSPTGQVLKAGPDLPVLVDTVTGLD